MRSGYCLSPHAALTTDPTQTFKVLFEKIPLPMLVADRATLRVLTANAAALRWYGYDLEEMLVLSLPDLEEDCVAGHWAADAVYEEQRLAWHRGRSGERAEVECVTHECEFGGRPALLLRIDDLTARNRMRDQLERAERSSVIARFTSSVAHDFGNLISIIAGFADIILSEIDETDPHFSELRELRRAGESGIMLTRQLLAFSRNQAINPQLLNLNMHLAGAEYLLNRFLGEGVDLTLSLAHGAGNVRMDPVQLQQVIINMAINARDAMPIGGRLVIETENMDLNEAAALDHFNLAPGAYVMIAVSDTGCGMSSETQRRLFEPFFTTKEEGKGTGLGLAIVRDIVSRAGGGIYVYSVVGVGTTFKLYLPRVISLVAATALAPGAVMRPGGTETVLVVEDEAGVRAVILRALETAGYAVLEASCGEQALELCRSTAAAIDLVLTDIIMPGMGGDALAAELRRSSPSIKILLMSGYAGEAIFEQAGLSLAEQFLPKPILPADLLRKVREVLDCVPGEIDSNETSAALC